MWDRDYGMIENETKDYLKTATKIRVSVVTSLSRSLVEVTECLLLESTS